MSELGKELLQSAREALEIAKGAAEPAFAVVPREVDVAAIRKRKNMSQERFARTFGLAAAAVRDWEQNRRTPDRTARVLLAVIDRHPEAVLEALEQSRER
jgi:putative transcriptional regulator